MVYICCQDHEGSLQDEALREHQEDAEQGRKDIREAYLYKEEDASGGTTWQRKTGTLYAKKDAD